MVTVLEYVDTKDNNALKFITRVKFLYPLCRSDLTDEENTKRLENAKGNYDYFYIGKDFQLSEPLWFGDFIGSPLPWEDGSFNLYNRTPRNGTSVSTTATNPEIYGMWPPSYSAPHLVRHKNMPAVGNQRGKFMRDRYWGIQLWENTDDLKITLYSTSIAPGFTEDELKAFLPVVGRLLSPRELYGTPIFEYVDKSHPAYATSTVDDRKNLNLQNVLESSIKNDDPAGVNQIQYPHYKPFYLLDEIWNPEWLVQ